MQAEVENAVILNVVKYLIFKIFYIICHHQE